MSAHAKKYEKCSRCGRVLLWAHGRLVCAFKDCSSHGEDS